jgi:hypothetical protein
MQVVEVEEHTFLVLHQPQLKVVVQVVQHRVQGQMAQQILVEVVVVQERQVQLQQETVDQE